MLWTSVYNPGNYQKDKSYVGQAVSNAGRLIQKSPAIMNAIIQARQEGVTTDELEKEMTGVADKLKAKGINWEPPKKTPGESIDDYTERVTNSLNSVVQSNPGNASMLKDISATTPRLGLGQNAPFQSQVQRAGAIEYLDQSIQNAPKPYQTEGTPLTQPQAPGGLGLQAPQTVSQTQAQLPAASNISPLRSGTGLLEMPQGPAAQEGAMMSDIASSGPRVAEAPRTIQPEPEDVENAQMAAKLKQGLESGLITNPQDAYTMQLQNEASLKAKKQARVEKERADIWNRFEQNKDTIGAYENLATDYETKIKDVNDRLKDMRSFAKKVASKGPNDVEIKLEAANRGVTADVYSLNSKIAELEADKAKWTGYYNNAEQRAKELRDDELKKIELISGKKAGDENLERRRNELRERDVTTQISNYSFRTKDVRRAGIALKNLNDELKKLGIEKGLYEDPANINIPGIVGFGAKPFRNWVKSDAAKQLTPSMYGLLNSTIRAVTGAQMNKEEAPRIERELGLSATSTVAEFVNALQLKADQMWNELASAEAGLFPEALQQLRSQGIFTASDIPMESGFTPQGAQSEDAYVLKAKAKELIMYASQNPDDAEVQAAAQQALLQFPDLAQ